MNLKEYIDDMGIRQNVFARKAKVSKSTITNICAGMDMRLSVAKTVIDASEGKVSYGDLARAVLAKKLAKKDNKGKIEDKKED